MIHLWRKPVRDWTAPDGTQYKVEVTLPGTSSALVIFHRPNQHEDRYATWQAARAVSARLDAKDVLAQLNEASLRELYIRSAVRSAGETPMSS